VADRLSEQTGVDVQPYELDTELVRTSGGDIALRADPTPSVEEDIVASRAQRQLAVAAVGRPQGGSLGPDYASSLESTEQQIERGEDFVVERTDDGLVTRATESFILEKAAADTPGVDAEELRVSDDGEIQLTADAVQQRQSNRVSDAAISERVARQIESESDYQRGVDYKIGVRNVSEQEAGTLEAIAGATEPVAPGLAEQLQDAIEPGRYADVEFFSEERKRRAARQRRLRDAGPLEYGAEQIVGPPGAFESGFGDVTGGAAEWGREELVDPGAEVAGDVAEIVGRGTPIGAIRAASEEDGFQTHSQALGDVLRPADQEVGKETTGERVTETFTKEGGNLAVSVVEALKTIRSVGELGYEGGLYALEKPNQALPAAGGFAADRLTSAWEYAANNPVRTAGQLAGSVAVMGGAAKLGSRAGLASRAAIQPGEEILGYGGAAAFRGASGAASRFGRTLPEGRASAAAQRVSGATSRAGDALFPNNEPLLMSEEAAIRAASVAGRGVSEGLGRARQSVSGIEAGRPELSRPSAGGILPVEAELRYQPDSGPIEIETSGEATERLRDLPSDVQETARSGLDAGRDQIGDVGRRASESLETAEQRLLGTADRVRGAPSGFRESVTQAASRGRQRAGRGMLRAGESLDELATDVRVTPRGLQTRASGEAVAAFDRVAQARQSALEYPRTLRQRGETAGLRFRERLDEIATDVRQTPRGLETRGRGKAAAAFDRVAEARQSVIDVPRRARQRAELARLRTGERLGDVAMDIRATPRGLETRARGEAAAGFEQVAEARQSALEYPRTLRQQVETAGLRFRDRLDELATDVRVTPRGLETRSRGEAAEVFDRVSKARESAVDRVTDVPQNIEQSVLRSERRLEEIGETARMTGMQLSGMTLRIDVGKPQSRGDFEGVQLEDADTDPDSLPYDSGEDLDVPDSGGSNVIAEVESDTDSGVVVERVVGEIDADPAREFDMEMGAEPTRRFESSFDYEMPEDVTGPELGYKPVEMPDLGESQGAEFRPKLDLDQPPAVDLEGEQETEGETEFEIETELDTELEREQENEPENEFEPEPEFEFDSEPGGAQPPDKPEPFKPFWESEEETFGTGVASAEEAMANIEDFEERLDDLGL
jgi:hypothetical protein